jgi:hypothetical protein
MTEAQGSPTKIAIAGPGRSGTSLLVKILNAAGLNTPGSETEYDEINAGRESRIGIGSPFDVDKDPWLYAYAESLSDDAWSEYRALVIPIRNLRDASVSRSKNERVSRLVDDPELDHWQWDTWGRTPGGAISRTNASEIGNVLSTGLWALIEVATAKQIPIVLLNFPAFARDPDYLWSQLSPYLPEGITRDAFVDAWKVTVRPDLAREFPSEIGGPDIVELRAMVSDLSSRIAKLKKQNAESTSSLRERDWQVDELGRILAETRAELARTQSFAEMSASLSNSIAENNRLIAHVDELAAESNHRIAETNERIDHMFAVVERSSQPLFRKIARFLRNRFDRR